MKRLNAAGAVTVFVGDGMSDRYAATCANVVFAKDKLAAFCDKASIPYTPYDTLAAVAEGMRGDLIACGKRMGLVLDVGGYYKNVFTLAPSFEISEEEIDLGVELLEQLIRRAHRAGCEGL